MSLMFEPAERFDYTTPKSKNSPGSVRTHWLGFDKSSNWQMIPKGGSRHLIIRNATDITFEATPAAKVNLRPSIDPANPRIMHIWVNGMSEGSCILRAKDRRGTNMGVVNLEVVVPRIVKTAFYRLADSERSASATDDTVRRVVERVKAIVWDQTNCQIEMVATKSKGALMRDFQVSGKKLSAPKTGKDSAFQPDKIDSSTNSPAWAELNINLESEASYHVFFVWGLTGANGVTKGAVTMIRDDDNKTGLDPFVMPVTLAHEFVHFLSVGSGSNLLDGGGHDPLQDDLMFDGPHGINIRKVRQDKLRRGP